MITRFTLGPGLLSEGAMSSAPAAPARNRVEDYEEAPDLMRRVRGGVDWRDWNSEWRSHERQHVLPQLRLLKLRLPKAAPLSNTSTQTTGYERRLVKAIPPVRSKQVVVTAPMAAPAPEPTPFDWGRDEEPSNPVFDTDPHADCPATLPPDSARTAVSTATAVGGGSREDTTGHATVGIKLDLDAKQKTNERIQTVAGDLACGCLSLKNWGIGDGKTLDVVDVLECDRGKPLALLDLSGNRLTIAGLEPVLLAAPSSLCELRLSCNPNLGSAARALANLLAPLASLPVTKCDAAVAVTDHQPPPSKSVDRAAIRARVETGLVFAPIQVSETISPASVASLTTHTLEAEKKKKKKKKEVVRAPMTKLQFLWLDSCNLGSTGLLALAPTLTSRGPTLVELNLSQNGVTAAGAAVLGRLLGTSGTALRHLHLGWNELGNPGVVELLRPLAQAARLSNWRTAALQSLGLSWNRIGSASHLTGLFSSLDDTTTRMAHEDEEGPSFFNGACSPLLNIFRIRFTSENQVKSRRRWLSFWQSCCDRAIEPRQPRPQAPRITDCNR